MKDTSNKIVVNTIKAELGAVIAIGTTTAMGEVVVPDEPTTCTDFIYTDWTPEVCEDGTQTRTVLSSSPENCEGGTPILTQSCDIPFLATGGTITYSDSNGLNPRSNTPYEGGYKIHTFLTSGTFEVVSGTKEVEYLVVGGGGGGGSRQTSGGGGGAGGLLYGEYSVATGAHAVVVGSGGNGGGFGTAQNGSNGTDSAVFDFISYGGGGGGKANTGSQPLPGGSGGGAGSHTPAGGLGANSVDGQGNDGGDGYYISLTDRAGGGGGGAISSGGNGQPSNVGGSRGNGYMSDITGIAVTYSIGGLGGGSASGTDALGYNGPNNTGQGGSGCYSGFNEWGGFGGSGIVVIRYEI